MISLMSLAQFVRLIRFHPFGDMADLPVQIQTMSLSTSTLRARAVSLVLITVLYSSTLSYGTTSN
jgi:hypothetical protein